MNQIYRDFPENISELVLIFNQNSIFTHVFEPNGTQLFVQPDAFLGRHVSEFLPPEIIEEMKAKMIEERKEMMTFMKQLLEEKFPQTAALQIGTFLQ